MMKKNYFLMGLFVVVLAGCGSPTQYQTVWKKGNLSAEEVESIQSECQYEMGKDHIAPESRAEMFKHCMKKKGFRQKKVPVK